MSNFGNKNVRYIVLFVPIFALYSRVDFSQKYIGRLMFTLSTACYLSINSCFISFILKSAFPVIEYFKFGIIFLLSNNVIKNFMFSTDINC